MITTSRLPLRMITSRGSPHTIKEPIFIHESKDLRGKKKGVLEEKLVSLEKDP